MAILMVITLLWLSTTSYKCVQSQLTSCMSDNEVGNVPKSIHADVYHGQRDFAITMLDAVRRAKQHENVFLSPYSTYHALLLAYFGSKGATQQELTQLLHLNASMEKDHVSRAYRLEKTRREFRARRMPLNFTSADRIYFAKEITLSDCMTDILYEELQSVDFRANPEQCRATINRWIAETTHNELTNVLSPGDVDPNTQLVLVNAAYFKGDWQMQFDKSSTQNEIFYTNASRKAFVEMMTQEGNFNMIVDDDMDAHILAMPYKTSPLKDDISEISMILVLPLFNDASIEKALQKLNPEVIARNLADAMPQKIKVSLPKFEFKTQLDLVPILRSMGANLTFGSGADFGAFTTEANGITFGDARHVAKIKVDEEGSTAAAATVLVSFRAARPLDDLEFKCNHPFIFLIYDHMAKVVLFAGIYRDPPPLPTTQGE